MTWLPKSPPAVFTSCEVPSPWGSARPSDFHVTREHGRGDECHLLRLGCKGLWLWISSYWHFPLWSFLQTHPGERTPGRKRAKSQRVTEALCPASREATESPWQPNASSQKTARSQSSFEMVMAFADPFPASVWEIWVNALNAASKETLSRGPSQLSRAQILDPGKL